MLCRPTQSGCPVHSLGPHLPLLQRRTLAQREGRPHGVKSHLYRIGIHELLLHLSGPQCPHFYMVGTELSGS